MMQIKIQKSAFKVVSIEVTKISIKKYVGTLYKSTLLALLAVTNDISENVASFHTRHN